MMHFFKKINWLNTIFILFLTPCSAMIGLTYLISQGDMQWATWLLAFVLLSCTGLSITIGYHRLFAHRSFKVVWPVRLVLALFGAAAFQGSILEWSTDHRNHHLHTDTDRDPYSIKKGFWYAHIGWLFVLDTSLRDFSNVSDLAKDPVIRFQHRFFIPLALLMGFGLPAWIASFWGDALGGLVIGGFLRTVCNHHITFSVNSVCHWFGRRPYSEEQSARDNWMTALITFGEGYHNFHHQFPQDYRNGIRFYHFDPSKWIIKSLAKLRLASGLKRVESYRIMRYRLRQEEADMINRVSEYSTQLMAQVNDFVKPLYKRIIDQAEQLQNLKLHYRELKRQRVDSLKENLKAQKLKLKLASVELKKNLILWNYVMHAGYHSLSAINYADLSF